MTGIADAPKAKPKPLLTRADLPLDAIAEICRRWGVRELAVDPDADPPQSQPLLYAGGQPVCER